jgi:hypothetical protein
MVGRSVRKRDSRGGRHSRSRRTLGGGRHRRHSVNHLAYVIVPATLALAILLVVAVFLVVSDVTTSAIVVVPGH